MLAPLAGVSDTAFRKLCREYGAIAVVSEMVSVKGLVYGDKKSKALCRITAEERPMGIQLFGSEPEFFARAVSIINAYQPDWIDINMGCPVRKVTSIGAGCALMEDIPRAQDIVRATVSESSVPVTVKFRLGIDAEHQNAVAFAQAMESAGASAIAVHGRTKAQLYSGTANWSAIREVKESVAIPVIANGDVKTAEDCARCYAETNCDLVMIGRGSLGNPFIFREIEAKVLGKSYTPPSCTEKMETMLYHIRKMIAESEKPEKLTMHEARKHASWYLHGCPSAAKLRAQCSTLETYADAEQLAQECLSFSENKW